MNSSDLIYGLLAYLPSAWLALRIREPRLRAWVFVLVNWLGLFFIFHIGTKTLGAYTAYLLASYVLTIHRRVLAAWLPLGVLAAIRLIPVSILGLRGDSMISVYFIGFSYLAFRQIWLVVELKTETVKPPSLGEYLAFCFFVPSFSVGPITRYSIFNQSFNNSKPSRNIVPGFQRLFFGLAKYLVLGTVLIRLSLRGIFDSQEPHDLIDLAVGSIFYYLYLYCNFSGFCDLAVGCGMILGIEVEENFKNPFGARNISDFWNRWHITLSSFLRTMVFAPVSKYLIHTCKISSE